MPRVGELIDLTIEEIRHRLDRLDQIEKVFNQVRTRVSCAFPRQSDAETQRNQPSWVPGEDVQDVSLHSNQLQPEEDINTTFPLNFDVLLCFGEDTCNSFTTNLCNALKQQGIHTFMEEREVESGDQISERFLRAIEGASMAIPIFSRSFAQSRSCIIELGEILESKMFLLPIFYNVDPSDVRYQNGLFGEAFQNLEEALSPNIADSWRQILRQASEVAGFNLMDAYINGNENKLIQMVVETAIRELNQMKPLLLPTSGIDGMAATKYRDRIKMLLERPEIHKIGVWGMGGVGKTRVVSNIYNDLLNTTCKQFDKIIFVTVPYSEDRVKHVRNAIEAQLSNQNQLKDETSDIRTAALLRRRLQGRRFLLILDDLWNNIDFQELGVPEPNGKNGCKILLTTRNREVCNSVGTRENVKIEPMPPQEAWQLFCKIVGDIPRDVQPSLSKAIVQECGGLPLGIVVVAEYLRNQKNRSSWFSALNKLRNPNPLNQSMLRVFRQLRLSYDRLESQTLKDTLLACVFYIDKSGISLSELRKHIVLEGIPELLKDVSIYSYLNEELHQMTMLRDACLIEYCQDNGMIHLHGLMRSMLRNMISVDAFITKNDAPLESAMPLRDEWKAAERISLKRSSIRLRVPPYDCHNLVSLLLSGSPLKDIPKAFFCRMKSLLVLDLSSTRLNRLPASILALLNLRLLDLSDCKSLKTVYGVGSLKNLLYLNLNSCSGLRELHYDISGLINLRVLQLDRTTNLTRIPYGAIANLSCLEMLSMGSSAYIWRFSSRWHFPLTFSACLQELRGLQYLEFLSVKVENDADFEYVKKATEEERTSLKILKCSIVRDNVYREVNRLAVNKWMTTSTTEATSTLGR